MSKASENTLQLMQSKLDIFADLRAEVTHLALDKNGQIKNVQQILAEEEALLPILDIESEAIEMKRHWDDLIADLDNIADDGERTNRMAEYQAWKESVEIVILNIQSDPRYAKALAVKARRANKAERQAQELNSNNAKLLDGMDKTIWQEVALEHLEKVHDICDKLYGKNEGNRKFWSNDKWVVEARKELSTLLVKGYGLVADGKCFNAFLDSELKRLQLVRLEIKNARKAEREAAKKAAETPKVETKAEEPTMSEVISTINDVPLAEPVVEDKPTKKGNKKGGRKPPVDKEDEAGFEKAIAGKNRRNAK